MIRFLNLCAKENTIGPLIPVKTIKTLADIVCVQLLNGLHTVLRCFGQSRPSADKHVPDYLHTTQQLPACSV